MAIPHFAAIFFVGSRFASRGGRLRNDLAQRFGGFERQFERLKRLHGMAAVSCDAKRSVQAMTLSGFSEKFAWHPAFLSVGPSDEGVAEPKNPMVGNFAVCCERTASGHLPPRRERPGIFVA